VAIAPTAAPIPVPVAVFAAVHPHLAADS
jgi:hypothetical protein